MLKVMVNDRMVSDSCWRVLGSVNFVDVSALYSGVRYRFGPVTSPQADLVRCLEPWRKATYRSKAIGYDALLWGWHDEQIYVELY